MGLLSRFRGRTRFDPKHARPYRTGSLPVLPTLMPPLPPAAAPVPTYAPYQQPSYVQNHAPTHPEYNAASYAGYDAASHQAYNAPPHPAYNTPSHPAYNAPSNPGYDAPHHPEYDAPHHPEYPAPPHPGYGTPPHPEYVDHDELTVLAPAPPIRPVVRIGDHTADLSEHACHAVGESNFRGVLLALLREALGHEPPARGEVPVWVQLVPEPDNSDDPNAVAAHIAGRQVGYLQRGSLSDAEIAAVNQQDIYVASVIWWARRPVFGVRLDLREGDLLGRPRPTGVVEGQYFNG